MALVTDDRYNKNGLAQATPETKPEPLIESIAIADPSFQNTVIDTRWTPKTNLLTHIEGSSWRVDYYSQILTSDSELSGQQLTSSSVYQSYKCIFNMEMKVSSALATDQDDTTKAMRMTGTALLYPCIIPNEGDMFVADIGEGKLGVFRVTMTGKKSIFKEACYEITYGLDTDASDKLVDLKTKTVTSYYFNKDFLTYGQNPLIIKSDLEVLIDLEKQFGVLIKSYFKKFYSKEYQTLILPDQGTPTYDHFLVSHILSQFNSTETPELLYLRSMNLADDHVMQNDNFWIALANREPSLLINAFQKVSSVTVENFRSDPVFNSVAFSGIRFVIYPIDPILDVDYSIKSNAKRIDTDYTIQSPILPVPVNVMSNPKTLQNADGSATSPLYPALMDRYYVLSANFYNNTETQSVLEVAVNRYIHGKEVDALQLLKACKEYYSWGSLEQFYYAPIILTMIKATIRGV